MPAIDPDDLPKKKVTHEVGQDLALLSVGELAERIGLLREEIAASKRKWRENVPRKPQRIRSSRNNRHSVRSGRRGSNH